MMIMEKMGDENGVAQEEGEDVARIATLHTLCRQLAEVEAQSAQVTTEMRQADARGARREVLLLFKELCDLILLGARVETQMARILLKANVPVND